MYLKDKGHPISIVKKKGKGKDLYYYYYFYLGAENNFQQGQQYMPSEVTPCEGLPVNNPSDGCSLRTLRGERDRTGPCAAGTAAFGMR